MSKRNQPDPDSPKGKARRDAAEVAFILMMAGVDALADLGFKKKGIVRLISIHLGRRKSRAKSLTSAQYGTLTK